ncbi:unnamed protein product [Ambrosiozyma monospora]|uniref:Unnamed protein product n=1 Tax=Ambrosiozyma monospora TaxID=43982 RepID=A0ACB5U2R2_AMBMO|nr:unnamed protein product [Ambrosiozyma monospora]
MNDTNNGDNFSEIQETPQRDQGNSSKSPSPKKKVIFASDPVSSPPSIASSPLKSPFAPKSILRPQDAQVSHPILSYKDMLSKDLTLNDSWAPGQVITLDENNLKDAKKVYEQCLRALCKPSFTMRYELYATLNHIMKTSLSSTGKPPFIKADKLKNLLKIVDADLEKFDDFSKTEYSAFDLREQTQAVKFLSGLVANYQPKSPSKWIEKCANRLRDPEIPKSLAQAYLMITGYQEVNIE